MIAKPQIEKFWEADKEAKTDYGDETFNAALRQVAMPAKIIGKSATKSRG